MSHQYAPKWFFREAENVLLKEYFVRRKQLVSFDWERTGELDAEVLYGAWQSLPEHTQDENDSDFRAIYNLASSEGTQALIHEGRCRGLDLAAEFESRRGFLDNSFWVFLNHRDLFDIVSILDRADHLNRRYWRKRKDMPRRQPDLSERALQELGARIGTYYHEHQARGKWCIVEHYLRGNRCHYFFAYPKDYTNISIGYDEEGRFERRLQRPAFEIVFVYDPVDGTLDLHAHGEKKLKQELQKRFAKAILHVELGEEDSRSVPYKLDSLKSRSLAFPTDPVDGVTEVRIKELRVAVAAGEGQKITFEVPARNPRADVHDLMEHSLSEKRLPLTMVSVASAVIRMKLRNGHQKGRRQKTVSFRISDPDGCNLGNTPEDLVAKKYLKLWGIERV